ncbi:hypothetical protein ANO11243_094740 [Dothideomycetidae sp. 11243]|nr:hypothetical protein ANO11243_094740 [fungal sp. No.11243]
MPHFGAHESEERDAVIDRSFRAAELLLARAFNLQPEATYVTETQWDDLSHVTESTVASALVQVLASFSHEHRGQAAYNICMGMISLARSHPEYMDALLKAYLASAELAVQRGVTNGCDTTLRSSIVMQMAEATHGGYMPVSRLGCIAFSRSITDPQNEANLCFTEDDVDDHLDEVVHTVRLQVFRGNSHIIEMAMLARFTHLINANRPDWDRRFFDQDAVEQLRHDFEKASPLWCKAEFIASLLRLRGYAKDLFDNFLLHDRARNEMALWEGLLKRWLYDKDLDPTRDLMLKHHVVDSLLHRSSHKSPMIADTEQHFTQKSIRRGREYAQSKDGSHWTRKVDPTSHAPLSDWTRVDAVVDQEEISEAYQLSVVAEHQAPGEPKHWALFCHRPHATGTGPGTVWQVTGDAEHMVPKNLEDTDALRSPDFAWHQVLNENLSVEQRATAERVVHFEPAPRAPSRAAVTENCQGWVVRVVQRLELEGIVKTGVAARLTLAIDPVG